MSYNSHTWGSGVANRRKYKDMDDALESMSNQIDSLSGYSSEERCIGKWIDGTTDVYEKSFFIQSKTLALDEYNNLFNVTDLHIDKILDYDGIFYGGNNTAIAYKFNAPIGGTDINIQLIYNPIGNTKYIQAFTKTSSYATLANIRITIRYTKTN